MAKDKDSEGKTALLARIAAALDRLAPAPLGAALPDGDAFIWEPTQGGLIAVPHVAHVHLSLLKGVHEEVNRSRKDEADKEKNLVLIEIHREDIDTLPLLLRILRASKRR